MLLHVLLFTGITIFPTIHVSHVYASSSTQYLTNSCLEKNSKSRNEPYTVSTTCRDLEEANFSNLSLSRVPKFPVRMSDLKKLNLSYNEIVSVPRGTLLNLVELEIIDVSHNRILTVHEDAGFRELLHLQEVYLDNNRLGVVHLNMFEGLSELNLIHLQNNRDLCLQSLLIDWFCKFKGMLVVANCNVDSRCVNHFFNKQCSGHPIDIPSCIASTVTHPPAVASTATVTHPSAYSSTATVTHRSNTATVTHPSADSHTATVTHPSNTATVTHPSAGASTSIVTHPSTDGKTANETHPSNTTVTHPFADANTSTITQPFSVVSTATGTYPSADVNTATTAPLADGIERGGELLKGSNGSDSHKHPFRMNDEYKFMIVCGVILNIVTAVLYFFMYWRIQISFSIRKIE